MSDTYPTETLLEFAFAAYRVNNGYVKRTTMAYEEGKTSVWANKELVSFTAGLQHGKWIPETFVPLKVTDEDRQNIQKAHKYFRRYTMLVLGDSLSEFQQDMYRAYSKENNSKDFGLLAYIPQFIEQESESLAYSRKLKTEYADSVHIHGSSFQGKVEIIKRIFLAEWDTFLYFAGTDGKLISFSKKDKYEVEAVLDITARIKSQDVERETQLPMTRMNYVKVF